MPPLPLRLCPWLEEHFVAPDFGIISRVRGIGLATLVLESELAQEARTPFEV